MSKLAEKIYNSLSENPIYYFDNDIYVKSDENLAIDELYQNGYINIKMRTIGYVIVEII